ncbi:MAG: hypothetical protein U9N73_00545 [Candidatus Auribacterota bacterium]|nr:hypothetical protein [Candidatus Auribacterota bacterium]
MKKCFVFIICILSAVVVCICQAHDEESVESENNDFYDNDPAHRLRTPEIYIDGEIVQKGPVNFAEFPVRSLLVKETKLEDGEVIFIGAYRYEGYSLFDILKERILKKKNMEEFPPPLDSYLEIENARGEKVVVSWGEIFYPSILNRIIIATSVSPIVPSRSGEQWPIPKISKMVFADDLLAERNLTGPVKITVRSAPRSFPINRKIKPLYSPEIKFYRDDNLLGKITEFKDLLKPQSYKSIFYGKGRGLHSISDFSGYELKEILAKYFSPNTEILRRGFFTIAAVDGYRVVFSASEIFNRNDWSEFLILDLGKAEGGKFKVFPAPDFFSDRAIKAVSKIHFDLI